MDKILLFIPMYNCEKQIVRVLAQLNTEVCSFLSEAIIVNNRSTDGGEDAVYEYLLQHPLDLPVRLLRNHENYGLGGSHKIAFRYAVKKRFDYIIVLHGDDQGNITDLVPYLRSREYARYDCMLGARFMKGARLEGYSKFRTFGNRVYNLLFSAGTGTRIYDLGSGLNMYRVEKLESQFYIRYKDSLMFNYCMILGSSYYKHRIKFFPVVWREEDQVSNVKMVSQAMTVLWLLATYVFAKKRFITGEHRDRKVASYKAKTVYRRIPGRQ